jgi:hypothetical protein
MHLPWLSCEVEADGIAHLFPRFGVGERCAGARTVVAVGVNEREGPLHGGNATIAYARTLRARVRVERARLHERRRRRAAVLVARPASGWDAP